MNRAWLFISCVVLAGMTARVEAKPYTRNVAIVVYENAEPLDWTGPFEVYNDAAQFGTANGEPAFNVYIVSKTKDKVNAQGLWVVPQYSVEMLPKARHRDLSGWTFVEDLRRPGVSSPGRRRSRSKRKSRSRCAPGPSSSAKRDCSTGSR
jgi:hypothetical protein